MENRKIKNATPTALNGITLRSKLEGKLFKVLEDEGFNPKYEPYKFHIWKGFKPSVPFYAKDIRTKSIALRATKLIDITYTPDIVFEYNGYTVFVEVKPDFMNDVYPYKEKLFRQYMETEMPDIKPIFVRVGTIRNLKEFIKILRENYNEKSE